MKICISYDNTLVPYTTGNYFRDAFERFAEVVHVLPQNLVNVNPNAFDLFVKIDDGLVNNRWRPDLKPSIYYLIDSHIEAEPWRHDMCREGDFDYIFCAQKNAVDQYKQYAECDWVPLGCDANLHTWAGQSEKLWDIAFIGNLHSEYRTKRIETLDVLFRAIPDFYYGQRSFKEMAKKFKESKIVFNHAINNDVNMRYFEAACSGSMQLATRIYNNGLEELFTEGEEIVLYDTHEDMVAQAKYYLKHPQEREQIARNARRRALSEHTYVHRARSILEAVNIPVWS